MYTLLKYRQKSPGGATFCVHPETIFAPMWIQMKSFESDNIVRRPKAELITDRQKQKDTQWSISENHKIKIKKKNKHYGQIIIWNYCKTCYHSNWSEFKLEIKLLQEAKQLAWKHGAIIRKATHSVTNRYRVLVCQSLANTILLAFHYIGGESRKAFYHFYVFIIHDLNLVKQWRSNRDKSHHHKNRHSCNKLFTVTLRNEVGPHKQIANFAFHVVIWKFIIYHVAKVFKFIVNYYSSAFRFQQFWQHYCTTNAVLSLCLKWNYFHHRQPTVAVFNNFLDRVNPICFYILFTWQLLCI